MPAAPRSEHLVRIQQITVVHHIHDRKGRPLAQEVLERAPALAVRRPRPEEADAALPQTYVLDVLGLAPARALVRRRAVASRRVVAARFARRAPELVGHGTQRPDADEAAGRLLEGVDLVLVEGHELAPLEGRRHALADGRAAVVARPALGAGARVRRGTIPPIRAAIAAF